MQTREIIKELFRIGAVKFGEYTLKSGEQSPVYVDLRLIISYPNLLRAISQRMWDLVQTSTFDVLCAVPYTALPIATCMSLDHNVPMLMRRKEIKTYGTKKIIEGSVRDGATCLIVEDLVTSGASILETVKPLNDVGVCVQEAVVLIDREREGSEVLRAKGISLHKVFSISQAVKVLNEEGFIDASTTESLYRYVGVVSHVR